MSAHFAFKYANLRLTLRGNLFSQPQCGYADELLLPSCRDKASTRGPCLDGQAAGLPPQCYAWLRPPIAFGHSIKRPFSNTALNCKIRVSEDAAPP